MKKYQSPKRRNPIARDMHESGIYKPKIIPKKKVYKRKEKHKNDGV